MHENSSREGLAYLVWKEASRTGRLPELCGWTGSIKCNFNLHIALLLLFPPSTKTSYFLSVTGLPHLFLFPSLHVKFTVSHQGSFIISLYFFSSFSLLCTICLIFILLLHFQPCFALYPGYCSPLTCTSLDWLLYDDPNLIQWIDITNGFMQ